MAPDDDDRRFADSFDDFVDDPGSPFARSPLLGDDPLATNRAIVAAMDEMVMSLFRRAAAGETLAIGIDALADIHRDLFVTTFPEVAGVFRAGADERGPVESQFTVRLAGRPAKKLRGTTVRRLPGELDRCFSAYDRAVTQELERGSSRRRVAEIAAHTYGRLLQIHPFLDGNLRSGWCLLQAILLNHRFSTIAFPDLAEHEHAVACALWPGGRERDAEPLVSLIEGELKAL